ncbi:hypothetical protein ZIOFF_007187 [Zingiber officinale]|uniref:Wbp11/ELF5/Saf1 N-terminal domain-containing protein n=1 Tax=Zingiber officinale TaxID=94328 RepID=A0A8J5LPU7_ZINOF|nr:hypothetical protein ZIOFF_007187 [Zingiber officinale]
MCGNYRAARPRLHTVLAVDIYSDKIKHQLDRRRGKKPRAALGVAESSSTASISSTTPGSRASSRCRIWYCSENNKRVIHFSTCEVYGKMIGSFLPNDHPLRKNKKERKKVCEVDILKKDPEAIREQIEKLERMSILIVLFFLD